MLYNLNHKLLEIRCFSSISDFKILLHPHFSFLKSVQPIFPLFVISYFLHYFPSSKFQNNLVIFFHTTFSIKVVHCNFYYHPWITDFAKNEYDQTDSAKNVNRAIKKDVRKEKKLHKACSD